RLLLLPGELRNKIIAYLLEGITISITSPNQLAILLICKQLHGEYWHLAFSMTTWRITNLINRSLNVRLDSLGCSFEKRGAITSLSIDLRDPTHDPYFGYQRVNGLGEPYSAISWGSNIRRITFTGCSELSDIIKRSKVPYVSVVAQAEGLYSTMRSLPKFRNHHVIAKRGHSPRTRGRPLVLQKHTRASPAQSRHSGFICVCYDEAARETRGLRLWEGGESAIGA
ncbi:hypothetical protein LTS18_003775, partial [Coniosporium uncinatum]